MKHLVALLPLLMNLLPAAADELWRGYPRLAGSDWVDTGSRIGHVYVPGDPWIFSASAAHWLYLPEGEDPGASHWTFWQRTKPHSPDMNFLKTTGALFTQEGYVRALASLPSHNLMAGITVDSYTFGTPAPDHLSLTVSRDVREYNAITLWVGRERLATFAADYVSAGQRLRIPLTNEVAARLSRVGSFTLTSSARLWVVAPNEAYPRLGIRFCYQDEPKLFLERLKDSAITQFGWMHGCVLDGLYELHAQTGDPSYQAALDTQLGQFLKPDSVDYEGPTNQVQVNSFSSIELTLPFAVIAKLHPEHPSIPYALQFLYNHLDANGLVTDGWATTAEGCYTVAYPLMAIGKARGDPNLVRMAYDQLRLRQNALWINNTIYLRNNEGYRSFQHWARGICWYFLGHVRTLIASQEEPTEEMLAHLRALAAYVASYQTSEGLWRNFINDSNQLFDTSGSSGIACALALAANRGWIDAAYLDRAVACHEAIPQFLVDGGFLASVAPNNKLGESEQRSNRRTCEPFALGLYGQLHAALLEDDGKQ